MFFFWFLLKTSLIYPEENMQKIFGTLFFTDQQWFSWQPLLHGLQQKEKKKQKKKLFSCLFFDLLLVFFKLRSLVRRRKHSNTIMANCEKNKTVFRKGSPTEVNNRCVVVVFLLMNRTLWLKIAVIYELKCLFGLHAFLSIRINRQVWKLKGANGLFDFDSTRPTKNKLPSSLTGTVFKDSLM